VPDAFAVDIVTLLVKSWVTKAEARIFALSEVGRKVIFGAVPVKLPPEVGDVLIVMLLFCPNKPITKNKFAITNTTAKGIDLFQAVFFIP